METENMFKFINDRFSMQSIPLLALCALRDNYVPQRKPGFETDNQEEAAKSPFIHLNQDMVTMVSIKRQKWSSLQLKS
jgi:hypothetical protein